VESPNGSVPLDPGQGGLAGHRRRRSRKVAAGVGIAAVIAAAAGVAAVGVDFGNDTPANRAPLPPATDTVKRMTLTETETVNGTLGYGDATTVSGHGGTVTWLPAEGARIARGKAVYRRDDAPVPLLYGTLPLYRVLKSGVEGADVKEFEQNLSALGYTGFTVDDQYTSSTASAVKQWQSDLGLTESGTVQPGDVVLAPGAIRVSGLTAAVGAAAGGPVLSYTGITRVVDVPLDVAKQSLVHKGISATITLPDNSTVDGKVSSVGTVATTSGTGNNATTSIDVVVSIADQSKLGTLDAAPVTLTLVSDSRQNVLTVPVAALVALAEGGYGVQVVNGSTTSYVAVKTGMFANGRVEVSGNGIDEGTVVGVPQ
jgi:peptidoglycan hydrolase-like protein with peptidoglycan-binding domain